MPPTAAIPAWAVGAEGFSSITRTDGELSIVCAETVVPKDVKQEAGWRAFKIEGPLDFGLTGILAALANPLAEAGISIFALSTYNTDYLLVKDAKTDEAIQTLRTTGHTVTTD